MEYESYKMTHIYNEKGNNKGGNHEPVNRFEFKKRMYGSTDRQFGKTSKGGCRDPRTDESVLGPPVWSGFKKKGCRIHGPPVWSEF